MRFEELKLAIGTHFNLTIIGQDYKRHHCRASLIGYQKSKRLIVELINKPPQVLLHEGLNIEASISNAVGHAKFESEIDEVDQSSSPFLILDYPAGVDFNRLRKQPRLPVDTPVEIVGQTALGMATSAMHGYMLDVSASGARIVVEKELTKMVTQISVGVLLENQSLSRDMTLNAKICKKAQLSSEYPDYSFAYGIEFCDLNETDAYFIQALCLQMELQSRQLICEEE